MVIVIAFEVDSVVKHERRPVLKSPHSTECMLAGVDCGPCGRWTVDDVDKADSLAS